MQQQEYYPFGLTFNEYRKENGVPNLFQYNGKEKQDELGLGWLDYGARMYMAELGRWGVSDPLTAIALDISPYAYCYNNPVNYVDPTGMFGEEDEQGRKRFDSFTGAYIAPMDRTEGLNDTDRANRDGARQREGRNREVTSDDISASYRTQEYGTDAYARGELVSHTPEGYYLIPSSNQQGDPSNSAKLAEFLAFYFRKELSQVKLPINIFIDPNLDDDVAGITGRTKDNTIEMRINKKVFSDARQLYVTMAHELTHARDFNPGGYIDHFLAIVGDHAQGFDEINAIIEYHGYMVGSRAAEGLNMPTNDEIANFQHYMYELEWFGLLNQVNEYLSKKR